MLTLFPTQEIFNNAVLVAAMVDRLTQAFTFNMIGNSYRLKDTKEWLKTIDN